MSLLKDIWSAVSGIGKGMTKTYDEQFDPVFTEMYPFEMRVLPPVSVQSLALIKNEDGSDRCVSCLACEKVCPSQVITIERKKNPAGKGFVLERFDIDLVNCMYCAACVESCPASAIVTIQDFELSTPNLQTLKADKDFLDFQGLRAQQWYSPKIGVEYRENVTDNNIHGSIVKAPLEEQPGGLAEMEKLREAGTELPISNARAPRVAMSDLPAAAIYAELKHEPVKPSAPVLEPIINIASPNLEPAAPVASSAPAPVAADGAPRSKKIKRWGEAKTDDSSDTAPAPAPTTTVGAQGPASVEAEAASQPEPPAPSSAPAAESSEAKPRSSKVKRWEPKN
jgi:NADH-quinone oxidoreductase subunit I